MMSRLPPPPQFLVPPPPMPSLDMLDLKIVSQLTCSSIRQQQSQATANSRLIILAGGSVLIAMLFLTITLIWLFSSRKQKQQQKSHHAKPTTSNKSVNNLSTFSSRSYETISSDHTGIYVESIDTSATTCSMDTTGVICMECYHQHTFQPPPYYHIISIPDVVPN